MKTETHQNVLKYVNSPSRGRLSFAEMMAELQSYMLEDQRRQYTIVIGTDSHQHVKTDFVTAIVIHRVGAGGRYFWVREQVKNVHSLRERIYSEALRSLEAARTMAEAVYVMFKEEEGYQFNMEIHVDIGERGETREMIKEVVGMIRGSGYEVKTKPMAYGAFVVADRHT